MKQRTSILILIAGLALACRLQTLLPSSTDIPDAGDTKSATPRLQPTSIPTQPILVVPSPILPTPIPEPVFGAATENLRVRGSPSTNAPIVDRLNQGNRAEIVGRTAANDWYQIPLPTNPNSRGWVSAEFIDLAGSLDNVPVTQPGTINPPAVQPTVPQPPLPPAPTPRPYPYP